MEIKSLKRVGTFEQYRLKRFKDLDNKVLAQLHRNWPAGATHAVFQFDEPIKNEWRVTKPLLPKYNAALIYSARPAAVKAGKFALPETIERGRLSLKKTIGLYKKILLGYHKNIKKLGPAYKTEMKTALKAVSAARTETLLKGGAPVTLFASYRRVNYVGKTCEWLLTGWGDPKLSKREAEFVDEDFWSFIKKSRLPVDFKTRSFMRESQEQARSRGFKPSYVTIAKMP